MQAGRDGPIKIGRAKNVHYRQIHLQTHNPVNVDTILIWKRCGHLEPIFHRAFAGEHIRGEWFAWNGNVEEAVAAARKKEDWWRHLAPPHDLVAEWCDEALGDDEWFEEEYADCVESWHNAIERDLCLAPQ